MRLVASLIVVLASMFLYADPAFACWCRQAPVACESAWRTDAVFLGRVLAIEQEPPPPEWPKLEEGREYIGLRQIFTFEVYETFRELADRQIQIHTGSGGGDCGFGFEVGRVYLVYAHLSKDKKVLSTSICTRTAPEVSDQAQEDLVYLRSRNTREPFGRITGAVIAGQERVGRVSHLRARVLEDIPVKAFGATTMETRTDSKGRFQFERVPLGNYVIEPTISSSFVHSRRDESTDKIEVHPGSCHDIRSFLYVDGQIEGWVTSGGKPAANVEIVLYAWDPGEDNPDDDDDDDESTLETVTDENGHYRIERIPVGRYVIGVNAKEPPTPQSPFRMTFYPNAPTRSGVQSIELKEGEKLSGIDLEIGLPYEEQVIRVKVHSAAGQPHGKPFAYLHDPEYPDEETVGDGTESADGSGWITLKALRGRTYWVHAGIELARDSEICAVPVRAIASPTIATLQFEARYPSKNCMCFDEENKAPHCRPN